MSIALTPAFIKRGILIVLLATLTFAAGFVVRDADAQRGSTFIACVNQYTGVMRMSDEEQVFIGAEVVEPPSEEVELCRSYEEAWELIAFPISDEPSRDIP